MSDPQFDVNAALGESYEYGSRTVLPGSYYPVIVHVGDTGASDPKMVELKIKGVVQHDESGNPILVEGGDSPFVELTLDVYEGPFAGEQVTKKLYITPGKTGGALGRHLGACHAITGQHAQTTAVCAKFGIVLPGPGQTRPEGTETMDQATRRGVRTVLANAFYAMDSGKRLAFVAALLNVPAWEGKRAIVKLEVEEYVSRDGQARSSNAIGGFLPLTDAKKGLAWVRLVEIPRQEATKALMDAQVAGG